MTKREVSIAIATTACDKSIVPQDPSSQTTEALAPAAQVVLRMNYTAAGLATAAKQCPKTIAKQPSASVTANANTKAWSFEAHS